MYTKIVVGTDGSETASEAVRHAGELARLHGAELIVVHGAQTTPSVATSVLSQQPTETEGVRSAARDILQQAQSMVGSDVKSQTEFREGDPADVVLEVAGEQGADLIVVGNRGMRGKSVYQLGSVPSRVAHQAPCHVLIVHTT